MTDTIIEPNYIRLHAGILNLFWDYYVYIDVPEYCIDKALLEQGWNYPITFLKSDFQKPGQTFIISMLKCRKKHSKKLTRDIFPLLHKKLSVLYGQEYLEFCVKCANALIRQYEELDKGDDPSEIFSRSITDDM